MLYFILVFILVVLVQMFISAFRDARDWERKAFENNDAYHAERDKCRVLTSRLIIADGQLLGLRNFVKQEKAKNAKAEYRVKVLGGIAGRSIRHMQMMGDQIYTLEKEKIVLENALKSITKTGQKMA